MLVTLEIVRRSIVAEGVLKPALPGDPANTITVTPKRARELINARVCRLPEVKTPEESTEKKPSRAARTRSTEPRASSVHGTESAQSSSPAGRRSRKRRQSAPEQLGMTPAETSASSQ